MDLLTPIGLILALATMLVGQALEGGHAGSLINAPAALIVFGGTFGASLIQSPLPVYIQALRSLSWTFFPPQHEPQEAIDKIIEWSNVARKEGLLGLEAVEETESDPFASKGLQLLVDGSEPESIRTILETEVTSKEQFELAGAKTYEAMGGYAPTIGILGAVMGLIHVMENLGDPEKLGAGIATAFVATIYGVGIANIVLLPVANKLKAVVQERTRFREMVLEGIVSIAEGENPRNIEVKLQGYTAQ